MRHDDKIIDRVGQDKEHRHRNHEHRVRHPDPRKDRVDGMVKHAGKPALEAVACQRGIKAIECVRVFGVK